MDKAVAFHRDTLGLTLKFASPFWSEFDTGATILALHAADADHPAGRVQLGFNCDDLAAFYTAREDKGLTFTAPPEQRFGATIARFLDSEGAEASISG
jgi:catechol 2,3-dioxygenase-like lactoylglutathione lyase family enzyme